MRAIQLRPPASVSAMRHVGSVSPKPMGSKSESVAIWSLLVPLSADPGW